MKKAVGDQTNKKATIGVSTGDLDGTFKKKKKGDCISQSALKGGRPNGDATAEETLKPR